MSRICRRSLALSVVLTLATASAVLAHPAFNPNQLPAGEAVDAVLVVPHGCDPEGGVPDEGAASPTVVLDLQLAPEVTAFEAHELEGWTVEREDDVVRWTATDGGTTQPIQFPVTLTVDGPADEPIHLSAFQECEQGSFRWIGTPEREAEYPAVRLTPTQGEIGIEAPDDGHDGHDHATDHEHGHAGEDEHGHAGQDEHEEHPEVTPTGDGDVPAVDESAEATADSSLSGVVVAVVLVALLVGAGLLWSRRSPGSRA